MKKKLHIFLIIVFTLSIVNAKSQNIYACTGLGSILKINFSDCSSTLLCHTDNTQYYDIAFCNGILYGSDGNSISSIDTVTGIKTVFVSEPVPFNAMIGDNNGNLYLASAVDGSIYKYAISSSTFSILGNVGTACQGDLTFKNNYLYFVGINNNLIKICLNPFSYIALGDLFFFNYYSFGLTTFSYSGTTSIYASVINCNNNSVDELYKINDSNATTTLICSDLGLVEDDIYGLASFYKDIEDIYEINLINNISIYPNPTTNCLSVEILQKSLIEILNIQGQTIIQRQLQQGKTDIDISGLAKGVYILRLNSNKMTEVTKFVKE